MIDCPPSPLVGRCRPLLVLVGLRRPLLAAIALARRRLTQWRGAFSDQSGLVGGVPWSHPGSAAPATITEKTATRTSFIHLVILLMLDIPLRARLGRVHRMHPSDLSACVPRACCSRFDSAAASKPARHRLRGFRATPLDARGSRRSRSAQRIDPGIVRLSLMVRSQPVSSVPASPTTAIAASTQSRITLLRHSIRRTAVPPANCDGNRSSRSPSLYQDRVGESRSGARSGGDDGADSQCVGNLPQRSRPAQQPVMKLASEPDTIERMPSSATSARRLGARPPIPPSRIASEPKFAKPHSA